MKTITQIAITLVGIILGSWAGLFCIGFILGVLCGWEGVARGIICHDTPGFYISLLSVIVIFIIFGGILGYKGGTRAGNWITGPRGQGSRAAHEYSSPIIHPQPNHLGLKRYCSNCGTDLDLDGLFCQECGSPIQISTPSVQRNVHSSPATGMASQSPPHSTSRAPRKPGSIWPAIIVVVIAFLFFVFIGVVSEEEIDDSFQGQPPPPHVNDSSENHLEIGKPIETTTPLPPTATPVPASTPKGLT